MMMRKSEVLAAFFAAAVCALAQDPDPPSRVARLNYVSGAVSFRPGTVDEWAAASVNYPLTTGDHLWADSAALTEMHIGSTAIRMASQTALSFLNLDDRAVQLSVTQGSVNIRIRELAEDESYEIDTPNVAITILRPGSYRVDADGEHNATIVTVIAGDASVTGGGQAFPVHARQSARISGMDELSYQVSALPPPDEFDDWCDQRDRAEEQVQSTRYIPTQMTGYEDLDRYGTWREEPDYGWVWGPSSVDTGWAPYRFGRWCWVEPWGWTWVDDAPWGFAPFHYGRWAYIAGGWVWVPGPRMIGIRPVYAPALVVFVGGPRFGGSAVWFPLGPRESFRPGYRASDRYLRNVNGSYNVAEGRYVNRGVLGAVTAVRESDFASGRHVLRATLSVDAREVARAPVTGFTAPVHPAARERAARAGARRSALHGAHRGREEPASGTAGALRWQRGAASSHGKDRSSGALRPAARGGIATRLPRRPSAARSGNCAAGSGTAAAGRSAAADRGAAPLRAAPAGRAAASLRTGPPRRAAAGGAAASGRAGPPCRAAACRAAASGGAGSPCRATARGAAGPRRAAPGKPGAPGRAPV